ncbi:MAG: L,D-transpeptidase family protein, partial [Pseudomonadota bacterium]
ALEARIGKNGVTDQKREGDSKTPLGSFALRQLYYRPDRLFKPQTPLPTIALRPDDLWCDDPDHPLYNRPVSAPFTASHEKMWREDRCYDLCIVLDYNLVQPHPQKGSAIFFHLTTDDHRPGPTEGCVAISLNDMLMILPTLHLGTVMTISTAD